MNLKAFITKLKVSPEIIEFGDTLALIEAFYHFTPTEFKNGKQVNRAGENSGSCKVFAFAQQQSLTAAQALACFGAYYRDDVLKNPDGNDHQNIRNFMRTGWAGIEFSGEALQLKPPVSSLVSD